VFNIKPADILLTFGGLVLGLGLAHSYFIFSITKLVYQTPVEKDATYPIVPSHYVSHKAHLLT
jgi:hypothetical protein